MSEGFVNVSGIRLWYECLGDPDSPPIVMLSGAMGSAISWQPELLRGLVTAGRHVVRFDSRDIGLSSHIDYAVAPYALDDMAKDTIGLLDTLAIDRAHLVGRSMGGMIGQLVALRYPKRVLTLTLLSTTPGPDKRLSPLGNPRLAEMFARRAETAEDAIKLALELFRALTGSRFAFDATLYRNRVLADAARGTNRNSAHVRVVLAAPSRLDALRGLQVRTLIIHGAEDPLVAFDHAEAMARAIPRSRLIRWEGVGHEMPVQLISELVDAIVDHTGAGHQA